MQNIFHVTRGKHAIHSDILEINFLHIVQNQQITQRHIKLPLHECCLELKYHNFMFRFGSIF